MSGRMGAKPLRVCLLESFRPSTSSSNECLTTREDHESPASPAHIPPWSGDRELRGRDLGGEWWALMDRRSHPARRQWPEPVGCAAWVPGRQVGLPRPAVDYLEVRWTQIGGEPDEWPRSDQPSQRALERLLRRAARRGRTAATGRGPHRMG
jgi:hypothetical protein